MTPHFFDSSYLKRLKISASTLFGHQEKERKRKREAKKMSGKEKWRKLFEHQKEEEKKQKKLAREKERFGLGPLR